MDSKKNKQTLCSFNGDFKKYKKYYENFLGIL